MVEFSKYEFYNKLLGGVILFRVTLGVTWTQLKPPPLPLPQHTHTHTIDLLVVTQTSCVI